MVVLEALARGIPVIAYDVGGVREALGLTLDGQVPGVLVAPDDACELRRALRRWLTDAGLRASLRDAAGRRRDFLPGWEVPLDALAELLMRLRAAGLVNRR